MKEFNPENDVVEPVSAVQLVHPLSKCTREYPAYIGMDVHKDTIAWAIALEGRSEPEYRGEIANKPSNVNKLIQRLGREFDAQVLLWCYEAGPCGYGLHRQLLNSGQDCQVVAPSKIPKQSGERIKTDRRDAIKLARLLRSGNLSGVWVPDVEQEAMRDLTRARSDMKQQQLKARQILGSFLLRHERRYTRGKSRWTKMFYNWLEELRFDHDLHYTVLQEYINAVKQADERLRTMDTLMLKELPKWSMAPVVDALKALRGIDTTAAMILLSELGDISRFESPAQLMAFLGLVPREHSTGTKRRQGSITLTGNTHARRILVESAWCYRFPARQTAHLRRKADKASDEAKAIAWRAQKRLCGRYSDLTRAGKNTKVVCVAVARELVGFIWAVVCQEMPKVDQVSH